MSRTETRVSAEDGESVRELMSAPVRDTDALNVAIGKSLRRATEGRFSLAEASAITGATPKTLTRWYRGQTGADLPAVLMLAQALELSIDDLLFEPEQSRADPPASAGNLLNGAYSVLGAIEALPVGNDIRKRLKALVNDHIAALQAIL